MMNGISVLFPNISYNPFASTSTSTLITCSVTLFTIFICIDECLSLQQSLSCKLMIVIVESAEQRCLVLLLSCFQGWPDSVLDSDVGSLHILDYVRDLKAGLGNQVGGSMGAAWAPASHGHVRVCSVEQWGGVWKVPSHCANPHLWHGPINMNLLCFTLVRCIIFHQWVCSAPDIK